MQQFKMTPIAAALLGVLASVPAWAQQQQAADEGTTVVVSGIRQSVRKAEDIKRAADQVVDSINAEDIGKFPDRSVGEALQRIPGVQVGRTASEVNSVLIRGLPDLATTINGNEIFTGDGRRLSYQDLRIEGVAGLDVFKSSTPNQQEGGIAGLMDVRLRKPFDFKGLSASGFVDGVNVHPRGTSAKSFTDPSLGGLISNRWKTEHGDVGVLLDGTYVKDRFVNPVQWFAEPGGPGLWQVRADGTAYRDDPSNPNLAAEKAKGGATTAAVMPFPGGVYNSGERERQQLHGALQWKPNDKLELDSQVIYMGYRSRSAEDYLFAVAREGFSATNVVLAPDGDYCNTSRGHACPIASADVLAAADGTAPYTASSTQAHQQKTDTGYGSFGAKYKDGAWQASTDLAFTYSKFTDDRIIVDQSIPNASLHVVGLDAQGHGGFTAYTPGHPNAAADPSQYILRGFFQSWNESSGRQVQWRNDVSYRLGTGFISKLSGGFRFSSRDAEYHGAEGGADTPGGARPVPVSVFGNGFNDIVPGVARLGGAFATPSTDFLLDNRDQVRKYYGLAAGRLADDPNRLFKQTEKTTTVYGMANYGFDVGTVSVSGLAGVRVSRVQRDLSGNNRIGDTISNIDINTSHNDVLPSASAKVDWTSDLMSHIGWGKTVTRPDFASLNPALSLTPPSINRPGYGSAGNPNLKPVESKSFDITLERYFDNNGYASAAYFDRRIDGYLQPFSQVESINGLDYTVTRPQNAGKGKLHGYELSAQKFLDFLPGVLSGLGVQANYTWISGTTETATSLTGGTFTVTPLTNVAKKNANLALIYEKFGISGRLAYTRRDSYVESLNNGGVQLPATNVVRPRNQLDLSVGYEINKQLSLQFNAWNLTHSAYESYSGYQQFARDIRYDPAVYSLGLRFKL
ncbi:TonB-dependent receptor [Duganella sp. CF402]|uniref:TonB-dependent receptor n=1 Tax=unclassified Duganella TaxID=2636909 RepID=UPI0008CCB255|nr:MULTISPECIES: TonB-dependent receptor [unclassified Duganella]RZT10298.1 TonB-dependent receptor [Duganella sp. BK701]SEL19795.1 TonB-dependent receptor [Duganella sp. CF402]